MHSMTVTSVLAILAICPWLRLVQAAPVADVTSAYIADLQSLFFFGGWDDKTPLVSTAAYFNLTSTFNVDSPPIVPIPALPAATSKMVPFVAKNGEAWDIILSGGVTAPVPFRAGVWVPGSTAYTYSVARDVSVASGIRVSVNSGQTVEALPFGPGIMSGATTAEGVFGTAYTFGGRRFPVPYFNSLRVTDKLGSHVPIAFDNSTAPAPRVDPHLVRLNATHILVAGGTTYNDVPLGDVWLFNIQTLTWAKYPHSLPTPVGFGALVTYLSPSSTRYVIHVGPNLPFIRYINLSQPGLAQGVDPTGQGPSVLESPVATMIGDQLVLVGGFNRRGGNQGDQRDQHMLRVIKIKEAEGKLSFEWSNTFTPIKPTSNGGSSPNSKSPVNGGPDQAPAADGTGERPEPTGGSISPAVIAGSSVGAAVVVIGIVGFIVIRRKSDSGTKSPTVLDPVSHAPEPKHSSTPDPSLAITIPGKREMNLARHKQQHAFQGAQSDEHLVLGTASRGQPPSPGTTLANSHPQSHSQPVVHEDDLCYLPQPNDTLLLPTSSIPPSAEVDGKAVAVVVMGPDGNNRKNDEQSVAADSRGQSSRA